MISYSLLFSVITALICVNFSFGRQVHQYAVSRPRGCPVGPDITVVNCNSETDVKWKRVVPFGVSCILSNGSINVNVTCGLDTDYTGLDLNHRVKRQTIKQYASYIGAGATVGSAFGPIGSGIGAVVGGLACLIFCDDPEPPNTPPYVKTMPTMQNSVIPTSKGKYTAVVEWTNPVIHDKEDGDLPITTYPANFRSGGEFEEGVYVVYFQASDSKGLPAHAALSFTVQVPRCGALEWPDDGSLECDNTDGIHGTLCTTTCDDGYHVSQDVQIECQSSEVWYPSSIPTCDANACDDVPDIPNGYVSGGPVRFYGEAYYSICNNGYKVVGSPSMQCDHTGAWNTPQPCIDIQSPKFTAGTCPLDIQKIIEFANNTASVHWVLPKGSDNSGVDPVITEVHGYTPGQNFEAGTHFVHYTITDKVGNVGGSCIFTVNVQSISCSPPILNYGKDIENHMEYTCPTLHTLGSTCTIFCKGGYPLGGVDEITCGLDIHKNTTWQWEGFKPFCQETNCPDLRLPVRGAMACSEWSLGQTCQMQCQLGYDVPFDVGDGYYVCSTSDGLWRPFSIVEDCEESTDPTGMTIRSELFYFTGECNSSAENLQQIQENFVQALNNSFYNEVCIGDVNCQAEYVNVTCGPLSARRKRYVNDERFINNRIHKRAATDFAYVVEFELQVPYIPDSGKTDEDLYFDMETILYDMSDIIQADIDTGAFDIDGLLVQSDSMGLGFPEYSCPLGSRAKPPSPSCVGCSDGMFMSEETTTCELCPYGTYQNISNSVSCSTCPHNTNTTEEGTATLEECLENCPPGHYSATGLAPCAMCPLAMYQDSSNGKTCLPCPNRMSTQIEGATSQSMCTNYDIKAQTDYPFEIESKDSSTEITFSFWLYVTNINGSDASISLTSNDGSFEFIVNVAPQLSYSFNGADTVVMDSEIQIKPLEWTHVALIMDGSQMQVHKDGQLIYNNPDLGDYRLGSNCLEENDTVVFSGDILVSSFYLLPWKALASSIQDASSTCSYNLTGYIFDMDDLAALPDTSVVIPSRCDSSNECGSSPCGDHECINNIDGFSCICSDGYSGDVCDVPPDFCDSNECKNGATCDNGQLNYTCTCPYGYKGQLCEKIAIDGQWSGWSGVSPCSQTCGGGTQRRTRTCTSPAPDPEGQPCSGESVDTASCGEDECPECVNLRRSSGTVLDCEDTDDYKICTISCRPGLYFSNTPAPFYECGKSTNYTWTHQTLDNPRARLPSCSALKPATHIETSIETEYTNLPCTDENKSALQSELELKISTVTCIQSSTCTAILEEPTCGQSDRRRRAVSSVMVVIQIIAKFELDGSGFNTEEVLENGTDPTTDLITFVTMSYSLEETLQEILNETSTFWDVVIAGLSYSTDHNASNIDIVVACSSGTIRFEVFCVEAPAGSYSDGLSITLCPSGQYQDLTGQSSCKPCPDGFTTDGSGSDNITDCLAEATTVTVDVTTQHDQTEEDNLLVGIIIGVVVSSFSILMTVTLVVIYKWHMNKRRRVNASLASISHINPTYNMPKKPVFVEVYPSFKA